MKIHFLLKNPTATDETLIYASFQFKGKRIRISTSDFIHPDLWLNQRARKINNHSELTALNRKLDNMESIIKATYYEGAGSPDELKNKILDKLKNKKSDTLYIYFDKIIAQYKATGKCSKSMTSTKRLLEAFRSTLTFEDIDSTFYKEFTAWIHRKGYTFKNIHHDYSKNYIGKLMGNLKTVLSQANEEGLTSNVKYKSVKRTTEKVYNVYNTIEELILIKDCRLPPGVRRARDLYLISAFTGLRFSDYKNLTPANFHQDTLILDMKKVQGRVIVPLHWIVKEILSTYKTLPEAPSNQKMNKHIKTFAKKAGINQEIIKTRTEGGRKIQRTYLKWQLMTTHTARRSMATNMYLAGIPLLTVSRLLGHSDVKQTLDYIKIGEIELSASLVLHPFFQH